VARYALCVEPIDPYEMADDVLVPLDAIGAPGGGTRSATGTELTISGAEVSAVHRVAGAIEVRLFNPWPSSAVVDIPLKRGWLVDLRGRAREPFEGGFAIPAYGIVTARLDDD
jgi:hypothetical protein